MLTPEQAQALIADGAQQILRKCGTALVDKSTLLECLIYANTVINDAMHNGTVDDITVRNSGQRETLMQQAAGILLLTLQQHGDALYTTHQLQRSLHPTQVGQKVLLLETQFIAGEAANAFNACYDAALNAEPYNKDDWAKLRGAIQKLGAKV